LYELENWWDYDDVLDYHEASDIKNEAQEWAYNKGKSK